VATPLPEGTITLLFTDIEGSTAHLHRLGDEYATLLADQRAILRAAFAQWNGHEVGTEGDSFFAVFARAGDAVAAAAEAQRALEAHQWPHGHTVRVRMGLHTGEPHLSSTGYVGMDVHRAARIAAAAHGGQVVLSQTTRDLVGDGLPAGIGVLDLGVHRFKDLESAQRIFQLVVPGLPATCPPLRSLDARPNNLPIQPTPLLGRGDLLAAANEMLAQPDVRLLTMVGPGGVGKSRLGLQLAADASDDFPDGVYFVALAAVRIPSWWRRPSRTRSACSSMVACRPTIC
jgi:class 3 adenylate cyclase